MNIPLKSTKNPWKSTKNYEFSPKIPKIHQESARFDRSQPIPISVSTPVSPPRRRGDGQRRPGRGRGRGHGAAHGEDQDEGAESCEVGRSMDDYTMDIKDTMDNHLYLSIHIIHWYYRQLKMILDDYRGFEDISRSWYIIHLISKYDMGW